MKQWHKIVGIVVGAIAILFLIALCIIGTKMGFSVKQHRESEQSEIVARIDSYINKNGRLPASLSELGFEQTLGLYSYKGNSINLIIHRKKRSSIITSFGNLNHLSTLIQLEEYITHITRLVKICV